MNLQCKRCLLRDMDEADLRRQIARTIERIPTDKRADDETYEARLLACSSCDALISGMCRLCGCFVEVRAARKNEICPQLPDRWKNT